MTNFTIFCECKDFGWDVGKDIDNTFISIIKNIELDIGCQLLSLFSSTHWSEKSQVYDLCTNVFTLSGSMKEVLRSKQVVCAAGTEKAWEVLLKNRQHCAKEKKDIDEQIRSIIKLVVYCQTLYLAPMDEELEPGEVLLTRSVRGYRDNCAGLISRGRFVYTRNEQLDALVYNGRVQMEQRFYGKFSISLKDYFTIISSIITRFHEIQKQHFMHVQNKHFFKYYPLDLNKSLGSLDSLHPLVESLLEKLSLSYEEIDVVFQENDKTFTDTCVQKPFFKLSDGRFVPINKKWLDDLLWISLYYKIADCYENNLDFYNFFGYLFENYVCYLTKKTCEFHGNEYKYIPEFLYGKPSKKSPDAMISFYNKKDNINEVLVIEAKSARLLYEMKKDGFKQDDIAKSLKKVVYDPLSQAEKAITDIIHKGVCKEITDKNFYCIMSVTMENVPFQIEKESDQYNLYFNRSEINAVHIAISIEEFEMLMQLLSQPNCESVVRDVFCYVRCQENTHNIGEILSFKNYLNRNTRYPQIYGSPGTITTIREQLGAVYQIDILPNEGKIFLVDDIDRLY